MIKVLPVVLILLPLLQISTLHPKHSHLAAEIMELKRGDKNTAVYLQFINKVPHIGDGIFKS